MLRRPLIGVALVGVMVLLVSSSSAALMPSSSAASGADRLPDEAMTNLRSFHIDTTTMPGHTLLRFTTESVNIGAGPLELRGSRPNTSTPTMSVVQRIYDDGGGFRDVSVPSFMFWAGDGHNHWHVNDFVSTELDRTDNGVKVGTGAKQGFCLSDSAAFNRPFPARPAARSTRAACMGGQDLVGRQDGHLGRLG